jgi:hypothetical protein
VPPPVLIALAQGTTKSVLEFLNLLKLSVPVTRKIDASLFVNKSKLKLPNEVRDEQAGLRGLPKTFKNWLGHINYSSHC